MRLRPSRPLGRSSRRPSPSSRPSRAPVPLLVAVVLAAALPVLGGSATATDVDPHDVVSPAAVGGFEWFASVEQVAVVGEPGATVQLAAPGGEVVGEGTLDALGGLVLRDVPVGDHLLTYHEPGLDPETVPIVVRAPEDHPPADWYATTTVTAGYGYLETRDGTLLGYHAQVPAGPGPHPTLVEYSGYDPSNPANPPPTGLLAGLLGYAYVGVNMRGTGCSGGSFDYFETLQSLDGYDVIEGIAAQPWSDRVGMIGISYPGISQLFVAATQPPSLTAIAPVSVISDTYRSTLYPGGIFNDGFALSWALGRQADARYPGGPGWVQQRINAGDETCAANQRLRGQNPDLLAAIEEARFYAPEGDALAPYTFVDRIQVPTLLVGAWQDEQTGGHFPEMIDRFAPDTHLRARLTNGTHVEPFGPENLMAMLEFFSFFVKEQTPVIPAEVRALAPVLYAQLLGAASPPGAIPPDRFAGQPYGDALATYLAEDAVVVQLENGMGPAGTDGGFPRPAFSLTGGTWPLEGTEPWTLHLGAGQHLVPSAPVPGLDPARYTSDPGARPRTNYRGSTPGCGSSSMWHPKPVGNDGQSCYAWTHPPEDGAATFLTAPLTEPVVLAGPASVDLWVGSDTPDVDLEAVLVEVRPDGQEMYLQSGYLRVGHRALAPGSTELAPRHLHTLEAYQEIPAGELVQARVQIHPFAHVLRPGSRLKLSIEPPGGNRPLWTFAVEPSGAAPEVVIGRSAEHPSRLVLPAVAGAVVPGDVLDRLPVCGDVRSQPCREAIDPPHVEPPTTEPPVTEPPVTEPPVTEPPVTEPPTTQPPVTEPPVTEPPTTGPPTAGPPTSAPGQPGPEVRGSMAQRPVSDVSPARLLPQTGTEVARMVLVALAALVAGVVTVERAGALRRRGAPGAGSRPRHLA